MRKVNVFALVLAGALFLVVSPPSARAQSPVNVTATVTDPIGIPYANATVSILLIPSGTNPSIGGQGISGTNNGQLDANGRMNVSLYKNTDITPGGTTWQFTICESPGVAPPLGTGGQCFTSTQTISAAVSLTTQFTAAAKALTTIALGTGSVTLINTTSPITGGPITLMGTIACATCVTASGGGSISITATQIAVGSGVNTIGGSTNLTFNNATGLFRALNTCGLTPVGEFTLCGPGSGATYAGQSAVQEIIQNSDTPWGTCWANAALAGNTGTTRVGAACAEAVSNGLFTITEFSSTTDNAALNLSPSSAQLTATAVTGTTAITINANSNIALSTRPTFGLLFQGSSSGSATIGVAAAAGSPAMILFPTTTGSAGQFLQTNGATPQQTVWATVTGTISGLTTGFLPKAGSSTTIVNSLCDEGITTANTLTCTDSAGAVFGGPVQTTSDGVHSGAVNLIGNTTLFALPANTISLIGPNSVSFTAYGLQFVNAGPAAHSFMATGALVSGVSPITFIVVPNCVDSGGNHLNYTQSTDLFSCGTSGGGSLPAHLSYTDPTLTVSAATFGNGAVCLSGNTSGTACLTAPAVAGVTTNAVISANVMAGPLGLASAATWSWSAHLTSGLYWNANAGPMITTVNTDIASFNSTGVTIPNTLVYGFSASLSGGNAPNLAISEDTGQGIMDVGSGAQGDVTGKLRTGNTVVLTSNFTTASTSLVTITGLSWTFPATNHNYAWNCRLSYSQATAAVSDAFGVQSATTAPTNLMAWMNVSTGLAVTGVDATLPILASTTATNIGTFTPSAVGAIGTVADIFTAELGGLLEQGAGATTLNIMILTSAGTSSITVYRGSSCSLLP